MTVAGPSRADLLFLTRAPCVIVTINHSASMR